MITKSQALAKLAANPTAAAQFDAVTQRDHPGLTRDEAVQLTIDALNLKRERTETLAALKKQSADLKFKLSRLKAAVAIKAAAASQSKPTPKAAAAAAPANTFQGASYAILSQAAIHRSSPPAEKAAARAELAALHGVTITPCGIISHSQRGGRAAKQSQKSN